MTKHIWKREPMDVVQRFEQRNPGADLGGRLLWSAWAVDALHYLADLDNSQSTYPDRMDDHHPDVVDITHVRWATGTAVTALDLCAAALGAHYCANQDSNEFDLRRFQFPDRPRYKGPLKWIRGRTRGRLRHALDRRFPDPVSKLVHSRRQALPEPFLGWVDGVLEDVRYKRIQPARNQFTHAWLSRHLQRGGGAGHELRTGFRLKKTGEPVGSRELVEISRSLATERVELFFEILDVA
jgi:hypothetical protein